MRGQLEGGYLRVSAATVRGSLGFLRVPDRRLKRCQKTAVWVGLRRLCHAAKTKKEYKGESGAYMNQVRRFARGISGLVVEYIVAIDVTRVQFLADAHCSHESVRAGKAVR